MSEMIRVTWIIAIANIALAIIYIFIYLVMRSTGYLTDRPYLVIEDPHIDKWEDGKMSLSFNVANYGKTPGWIGRLYMDHYIGPTTDMHLRNQRPSYGRRAGTSFGGVVVPAPHRLSTVEVSDDPGQTFLTLAPGEKDSVFAGGRFLYIHGFINYRDIHRRFLFWPNKHRSCFGYRYVHGRPADQPQFVLIANENYWHYT